MSEADLRPIGKAVCWKCEAGGRHPSFDIYLYREGGRLYFQARCEHCSEAWTTEAWREWPDADGATTVGAGGGIASGVVSAPARASSRTIRTHEELEVILKERHLSLTPGEEAYARRLPDELLVPYLEKRRRKAYGPPGGVVAVDKVQ